jgi:hypothetical protein
LDVSCNRCRKHHRFGHVRHASSNGVRRRTRTYSRCHFDWHSHHTASHILRRTRISLSFDRRTICSAEIGDGRPRRFRDWVGLFPLCVRWNRSNHRHFRNLLAVLRAWVDGSLCAGLVVWHHLSPTPCSYTSDWSDTYALGNSHSRHCLVGVHRDKCGWNKMGESL